MDRNGKKPKAARVEDAHPERSDTKTQSRDTTERMTADAARPREQGGGGASTTAKGRRDGRRA